MMVYKYEIDYRNKIHKKQTVFWQGQYLSAGIHLYEFALYTAKKILVTPGLFVQ